MGSPASDTESDDTERPQHKVTITKPFLMLRTEVTQWQRFGIGLGGMDGLGLNSFPIETISWYEAIEFCNKLSELDGFSQAYTVTGTTVTLNTGATGYRLPTEAEWEYAARAGTVTPRYEMKNLIMETGDVGKAHPVGSKLPNRWNLYDMLGNVYEWTQDWYGAYASGRQTDPQGPATGFGRVIRGGSWSIDASCARAGDRNTYTPDYHGKGIGFRPVRSLP